MNTHPLNVEPINVSAHTPVVVHSVATRVAVSRQIRHAVAVSISINRIRTMDSKTGVAVVAPCSGATLTQVSIAHRADFACGVLGDVRSVSQLGANACVSIARAQATAAITGVFLAKRQMARLHTTVYISRWPRRNHACRIRIDRHRMLDHRASVFVGRRRTAFASAAVSIGGRLAHDVDAMLRIDRRRRGDSATGIDVCRSHFRQHIMDLLPSVWRERDNGDLAAFLRLPADELDLVKNSIDRMPSLWDVDSCPPEYLQLLAVTLGWPFAPAKHVETLRRELREAIPFYRRKGTIPAIMRSLENAGWRGRLFETFRGMLRTNRRAQLNSMRLAGTVYNQGVYRVESENIVAGVRDALVPHHPAGVRVFFLQRLQEHEDLSANIEAGFKLGFRRADVFRQHEIFSLNRDAVNGPRPLTVRRFVFETMLVRQGTSVNHNVSESWGIVEQWQARRPVPAVNAMRLNSTSVATTDLTSMRKSLELVCATAAESRRIPPMRLGKTRLKRGGFQPGSVYRWRFRQGEQAEETNAALDSAANDWLIRQWPRIEDPAA